MEDETAAPRDLTRYMWLSIAAALATMGLKGAAAWATGSVAFLSDALESTVNLAAAVIGLFALRVAVRPPDREHQFGHGKAEYLAAAVEGAMIFGAAAIIVWGAAQRLMDPEPLEHTGVGLAITAAAALLNLAVGRTLVRKGTEERSLALVADGRHLLTDVWTSVGVVGGVAAVAVLDLPVLDPIVALLVGLNILRVGYDLIRRSVVSLLDAALSPQDAATVHGVLDRYARDEPVEFGPVRTREAGRQRFVFLTVRVPGDWTVRRGHDLADRLERDVRAALHGATAFTHVEPTDQASEGTQEPWNP